MADSLDSMNSFDANLEEIVLVGHLFLFKGFSWLQKQELWEAPSGLVALPTELLKCTMQGRSHTARGDGARVGNLACVVTQRG